MEVCDEQEVGKSVSERDGWRVKKSPVWAERGFFVISGKHACFLCLQLVFLKTREPSLRVGFK